MYNHYPVIDFPKCAVLRSRWSLRVGLFPIVAKKIEILVFHLSSMFRIRMDGELCRLEWINPLVRAPRNWLTWWLETLNAMIGSHNHPCTRLWTVLSLVCFPITFCWSSTYALHVNEEFTVVRTELRSWIRQRKIKRTFCTRRSRRTIYRTLVEIRTPQLPLNCDV